LPLGRWVLHNACKLLASWQDDPELRDLTMAVNVSSSQFAPCQLCGRRGAVLAITGAPSGQLKLELTESLLVEDMETTIATMKPCAPMGWAFRWTTLAPAIRA
jgi:EAL domain-containing protein (putative c-di-GMP-specific phosphodiesterase class I)